MRHEHRHHPKSPWSTTTERVLTRWELIPRWSEDLKSFKLLPRDQWWYEPWRSSDPPCTFSCFMYFRTTRRIPLQNWLGASREAAPSPQCYLPRCSESLICTGLNHRQFLPLIEVNLDRSCGCRIEVFKENLIAARTVCAASSALIASNLSANRLTMVR